MGITTNDFFENIYSVIFSPKAFFEREDMQISSRLAVSTVIFIAVITKLAIGIFNGEIHNLLFLLSVFGTIISTLIIWFLTEIFDKSGQLQKLLFYTAFVPIPYIFFAPLNLLKNTGDIGYLLGVNLEFLLYLWIICLYALAPRATYKLTLSRSFMLIFLPFLASFFAIFWLIGFIQKMWYIFSI